MMTLLPYLKETVSQTAGPYVHIGLVPHQAGFDIFEKNFSNILATPDAKGEKIVLEGRVIDGQGAPVYDALLEIWQADAEGNYVQPPQDGFAAGAFRGWGRVGTDFATGLYRFETVKPGSVMGRSSRLMAPHINIWIVARGINIGLHTRAYFSDESERNAADPVLKLIEHAERRKTLIAAREERDAQVVYRFDIRLQGEDETVFFDM
ncbi:protocatechuate 3,4-dioxygenase subunit alpha [Methylovirgula sp. 4M-Z18]|uniref:protocatechuate 3,4-dioxygenase subunit alpha n=1 Tax=Methylovirgula sp. 4M-Z18 TaxID=2293567 RepID=UPI000E2EBE9C|nr:protocatechuate 3,4-dioxygenase subunit alpha [Methylovirgula sp. 4M-Z18]RFB79454.1 protocatechuate 3,4-dioxygenase subunit alpha [Methylovirgula sp. 4M-Z18]